MNTLQSDSKATQTAPPGKHKPKPLSFRPGLAVGLVYLLIMASILIGTWALVTQDRVRHQKVQETELASLARAQEEHLARTFDSAVKALHNMAQRLAEQADRPDTQLKRLQELAAEDMLRTPHLHMFAIFSASGETLVQLRQRSISPAPPLPAPSFDHWRQSTGTQVFIHPAVKDAQGLWYIPVEQGVRSVSGGQAGSVFVLISVQDFEGYFKEIRLTPQDRLNLLTLKGQILLDTPSTTSHASPDFAGLLAQASHERTSVTYETTYQFDDNHHVGVFRMLRGLPLIVIVSRPTDVAQAGFLAMKRRLLTGVSALAVLLALLAWLVYSDARRSERARATLGRLNTSLEERVGRRTAELEQSNRELIAFSYSISHDLRTPLRAINGFAHALRDDYGEKFDAQGKDFLDRIYRASVRMGELIDELLALANISRAPLSLCSIDLTAVALEIAEELRLNSPGREVIFEAQAGMRAEGDEALLRNALSNLIHNAWKFTRSRRPGIVRLESVEEDEYFRFTLSDNGIGFDMAHAKRLFQPFQQLHNNLGYGGSGIGLASVRRIIERHGGHIWAEATPEQGARFIFTLPLRASVIRRKRK